MNLLLPATPGGTQRSQSQVPQSQVTFTMQTPLAAQSQLAIPISGVIPTSTASFNLTPQLATSDQEDRLSEASGHGPPIRPSPGGPSQVDPDLAAQGAHPSLTPPVPARLRTRILAGEYIDFNTLLTHAIFSVRDAPTAQQQTFTLQMSSQSGELQLAPTPTHSKKITSFALWMVAWNLYVSTILSAKPSRALEMFGYQRIITSLNHQLPFSSWMNYDIKFRNLAASYPILRWDVRHLDRWVECLSIPKSQPERWPCPHCGSMYHYPDRCPFRSSTAPAPPDGQLSSFRNPGIAPTTPNHNLLPPIPPSHNHSSPLIHPRTSDATSTTEELAHAPAVHSSTSASTARRPTQSASAPPYLWGIPLPSLDNWGPCTPLRLLTLERELCNHPDKAFVQLLMSDIRQGCNIGYIGPQFAYTARNLQSAFVNPSILDDALHSECNQTRILGPFNAPPLPNFRCSGLGIVRWWVENHLPSLCTDRFQH